MTAKPYGREHAMALLEPSGCTDEWTVDDRGLWPQARYKQLLRWGMHTEYELASWKPASVFADASDAPDLTKTPALPFPFDGRDLAAFMLAGYGCMVADFYGEWASGPDAHQLSRIDPGNNFAKRAVKEAFDAYRSAVGRVGGRVGGRDLGLYRRAHESCEAYIEARSEAIARHDPHAVAHPTFDESDDRRREMDAEYTRRMALVNAELAEQETEMNRLQAEDKAAEQKWRHAMAVELLKPAKDPAEHGAEPAPQVGPVVQPEATTRRPKAKRRTWWDVSSLYIVGLMRAGQYGTGKELYRALEAKAGPESPFDKGQGTNRGCLFVREIAQSLSMKTVQNKFGELRALAQKVTP